MDRSGEIFPHPLNDLPSAFQQERLDQFESPPCDPLAIFGRRRRMKFHNLQWAVGVYAGKFFAENLQCLLDSLFIRVPPGFCEFGYPGVVEAEAEIVGILRLVPPIESMGFHDKKVRQRNHPESDGVLSPCRSCSRESDGDRRTERKLAGIRLQHAKSGKVVSEVAVRRRSGTQPPTMTIDSRKLLRICPTSKSTLLAASICRSE